MHKLIQSSENPKNLSLTIKGLLYSLIAIFIMFAKMKGMDIGESELQNIADTLIEAGTLVGLLYGMVITLIGSIRKVLNKIRAIKK
jgi:hypothetical protein